MTFGQSIQYCFGNYGKFDGRAGRSEFWWFILFTWLVSVALNIIDSAIFRDSNIHILGILWTLAVIVPQLAVGCRRLHDIGQSGWLQLLLLIPCVGFIVLIVLWAQPTRPAPNQYGAVPA